MISKRNLSLIDILNEEIKLEIVDVGASYLEGDGEAVYKILEVGI